MSVLSTSELQASLSLVFSTFTSAFEQLGRGLSLEESKYFDETIMELVKFMKILCSRGREFQAAIVSTPNMLSTLNDIIIGKKYNDVSRNIQIKSFQLVANLCVDNFDTQQTIMDSMNSLIYSKLECDDKEFINVAAMILHCMVLSNHSDVNQVEILKTSLKHFKLFLDQPTNVVPDFVHILLDHLICTNSSALELYNQLHVSAN